MIDVLDGAGIYGKVFVTAMFVATFGSTLLVFFQLWRQGNLSVCEDVKYQMLNDSDEGEGGHHG